MNNTNNNTTISSHNTEQIREIVTWPDFATVNAKLVAGNFFNASSLLKHKMSVKNCY